MTSTPTKGVKTKKEQIDEMFLEGADEADPFTPIKKLFRGFCDPNTPSGEKAETNTAASSPSASSPREAPENDSKEVVTEADGETETRNGVEITAEAYEGGGIEIETREEPEKAEDKGEEAQSSKREAPVLIASHEGSKLRKRRGLEITIFSILAVIATLFSLHRLGFQLGTQVGSGEPRGIEIGINKKEEEIVVPEPEDVVEDVVEVAVEVDVEGKIEVEVEGEL